MSVMVLMVHGGSLLYRNRSELGTILAFLKAKRAVFPAR
jgi:hypothetical protein